VAGLWHDAVVPPHRADDASLRDAGPDSPPQRRAGRAGARRTRERGGVDEPAGDEVPVGPAPRGLSLGTAGVCAALTIAIVLGTVMGPGWYAALIFGVQLAFVAVWTLASRPPGPRVVVAVGIGVAAAGDIAVVWVRPAALAPLAYVAAAGFIAAAVGQMLRPAPRLKATESLGSSLLMSLGVVALGSLIVLSRSPKGAESLVICMLAAGTAITVARLADAVAPRPQASPQVPRGWVGLALGTVAGAVGAGVAAYLSNLAVPPAALAGLLTAAVAVLVDLSVSYDEASRRIDGADPPPLPTRYPPGPLAGLALAAPVAYAVSGLVLHAF